MTTTQKLTAARAKKTALELALAEAEERGDHKRPFWCARKIGHTVARLAWEGWDRAERLLGSRG